MARPLQITPAPQGINPKPFRHDALWAVRPPPWNTLGPLIAAAVILEARGIGDANPTLRFKQGLLPEPKHLRGKSKLTEDDMAVGDLDRIKHVRTWLRGY